MPVTVGVVFGGISPEHEVSIITSLQAAHAMLALDSDRGDREAYRVVPIYITKSGRWMTGDHLLEIENYTDLNRVEEKALPVSLVSGDGRGGRLVGEDGGLLRKRTEIDVDVLLLGLHGGTGETGGIQGVCETYGIPYTGSGVLGSSLGMDKSLTKMLCRDQEIPVVEWVTIRESEWVDNEEAILSSIEETLDYPVIVKPARLGSSIGIARADERGALDAAIEEAFRYDEKVVVEHAITELREINCSVLGTPRSARTSALEQPVPTEGEALLTFDEKYQRGGGSKEGAPTDPSGAGMVALERVIPAPISDQLADEIRSMAVKVFQLLECSGLARIDFLIDDATGKAYFNEINTIPGSFSFYLWEPAGVSFSELASEMIELALERHREGGGRIRSYDTNLLANFSARGAKGAKA